MIGEDRATLLFLVNLGCIDHNPWMSRVGSLEIPDYLLIDLDPRLPVFERSSRRRCWCGSKLSRAGLEGYPKTTGGDGLHIYVPLEPRYSYEQVRSFAEVLAHARGGGAARAVHHAARGIEAAKRAGSISTGRRSRREKQFPRRMFYAHMPALRSQLRSPGAK